MREQIYDGPGGPFDDVPDAPEACVVCKAPLPEDAEGAVTGHENDGCTCSEPCHALQLHRDAERRAADRAADTARYNDWLAAERAVGR